MVPGSIKLTNKQFTEDLRDSNSDAYKTLAGQISDDVSEFSPSYLMHIVLCTMHMWFNSIEMPFYNSYTLISVTVVLNHKNHVALAKFFLNIQKYLL